MAKIQHVVTFKGRFEQFDTVIIGSGPSGSTVANTLAEQGDNVLILELGSVASPGAILTEHQSIFSRSLSGDGTRDGNPWTACCVGGGMQFYSAITFRYREPDMRASRYLQSDLQMDWPIEINDLEEHYGYIENLLNMSNDRAYPTSARGRNIANAMSSLGYQPQKIPLAISPPGRKAGCGYCSACDSRSCPQGAKASVMNLSLLDGTYLKGNITVLYGCVVKRILLSNEGHAHALECYIPFCAEHLIIPVHKLICCGNAIQSGSLLLRSKSSLARRGIGNEHDLVGRGLSFKVSGYTVGSNPEWKNDAELGKKHPGAPATIYTDNFFQSSAAPTGLGGLLYEAASPLPENNIGCLRLHYLAGEEPWSYNRIILDDNVDGFGMPLIRFNYRNTHTDIARLDFLAARAEEILREAGASYIQREVPVYQKGSSHLHGTARAGRNPMNSVVDPYGKVHGYDNIYVMDASVMNFAGNWNPTHTIMANARRMAKAIS